MYRTCLSSITPPIPFLCFLFCLAEPPDLCPAMPRALNWIPPAFQESLPLSPPTPAAARMPRGAQIGNYCAPEMLTLVFLLFYKNARGSRLAERCINIQMKRLVRDPEIGASKAWPTLCREGDSSPAPSLCSFQVITPHSQGNRA